MSSVLQVDKLAPDEYAIVSVVKNPIQKMSNFWYGSTETTSKEAKKSVHEKERKTLEILKI